MPLNVSIDLDRIRDNARAISRQTGTAVMAVVKADAYGLGAARVVEAIDDVVDGYYVFHFREVMASRLREKTKRPILAAIGPEHDDIDALNLCRSLGIRLGCWTVRQAAAHREAGVESVLCLDTGMQRFACGIEDVDDIARANTIREAFTHASQSRQALMLKEQLGDRGWVLHAAGSALIDDPRCHLNAVRPGLALYHDALSVTCPLIDARQARGPAGYTGFDAERFGVIPVGYSHGLRKGPVLVNTQVRRVLEVGMQSAYIELTATDSSTDIVTLVGNGLSPHAVAQAWGSTPHEVLLRLSRLATYPDPT